jgi:hypothetical protein
MLHPAAVTISSVSVVAERYITATYNELQRLMTTRSVVSVLSCFMCQASI